MSKSSWLLLVSDNKTDKCQLKLPQNYKIALGDCCSWLCFCLVPDYSFKCSSSNKSFLFSLWSPTKATWSLLHQDKLWARFLQPYSTTERFKHPTTHTNQNEKKEWKQWKFTWKIPRHKHRCEDCTLWGRKSRDNRQCHSPQEGAYSWRTEWIRYQSRGILMLLRKALGSPARYCWTWHEIAQSCLSRAAARGWAGYSLGDLKWHQVWCSDTQLPPSLQVAALHKIQRLSLATGTWYTKRWRMITTKSLRI